jgi:hypothetical protein
MGSILYYSNFCEHSKKLLQYVHKTGSTKDIHFVCIDKRVKEDGKVYIVLEKGQKILMPQNVKSVPALLLMSQNYRVIYGDEIYKHLKPEIQQQVKQATQNNMVPMAFQDSFSAFDGFSSMGGGIASDNYSFLDQSDTDLSVKGNGGMRQMHSYVSLYDNPVLSLPQENYNSGKIKEGEMSLDALQRRRDEELAKYRN